MVEVLQSLLVNLSSLSIKSEIVRFDVAHVTGKEGKRLGLFPNKGGTTIFVLFASRGFYIVNLH